MCLLCWSILKSADQSDFPVVERPSEQADDSEVFYTLTQKGAEMAKRVAAGKVFPQSFEIS